MNKVVNLMAVAVLGLAIQGCSDDKKKGGNQGENLDDLAGKISHADANCPTNLNGNYCKDVDYVDEDGDRITQECFSVSLTKNADGQLVVNEGAPGANAIAVVDGKVKNETIEGLSVKTLAYCEDDTLYVKRSASVGYLHSSYKMSADGNSVIYSSVEKGPEGDFSEGGDYAKR